MFTEGQEVTLTINGLAFGGEGVGRVEQVPVFVPDVCPGEVVSAQISEVKKRFARGRLEQVIEPAPARVAPPCPIFGICGGCQLQHLDYPAQVAAKTQMVADIMTRVGHLPDVPIAATVPSALPFGYRNKVELTCAPAADGTLALHFHQREADRLVEVAHCPIALPEVNLLIEELGYWLNETGWPAYDPATGEGLVRSLALRYSTSAREATVVLTTGRRELPEKNLAIDRLRKRLPQVVGLRHLARTRASQSAEGRPVGDLVGRPLRFKVADLSLRVSPEAFFQVNDLMLEPMWQHLRTALEPRSQDHLADLYGGVGTFGMLLARDVERVTILEIDSTAAHDARANARFNELAQVEVVRGQVEQNLADLHRERAINLVVLDPPRRGLSEGVIGVLARLKPRRIAYISCDPATLARDLERFAQAGLGTLGVQPFDLFPQTGHIESIATIAPRR
ncbi:MAG: 23S rRNA (uracil(1939)-C(5))-methyltransferase RlmD [Armatimonadetes bacterium]|nr:23S rRNA (uracil(1939)-C(5))-methyltransferase RlmD [Armatimonadota bacterium]